MDWKSHSAESEALNRRIECIKYTIFSFNTIIWINATALIGFSLCYQTWPAFANFVDIFKISKDYGGIYTLLACSVILIIVASIGCVGAFKENITALYTHAGLHALCSGFELAGSIVLLFYYSAYTTLRQLLQALLALPKGNTPCNKATMISRLGDKYIERFGAEGPKNDRNFTKSLDELDVAMAWFLGIVLCLSILHITLTVLSVAFVEAKKKEQGPIFKRLVSDRYI